MDGGVGGAQRQSLPTIRFQLRVGWRAQGSAKSATASLHSRSLWTRLRFKKWSRLMSRPTAS